MIKKLEREIRILKRKIEYLRSDREIRIRRPLNKHRRKLAYKENVFLKKRVKELEKENAFLKEENKRLNYML
jgi:cell division protein FtsB